MLFLGIKSFLDTFDQYGIFITILIIFILILYLLVTNSTKRVREQEKKIDSLYSRIDKLMGKFTPDAPDEFDKFENYAENANKIQIQIYHLLQSLKADRISIYEFHNGGKNIAGVEFKKCTNMYEAVSLETAPIVKDMQNLPIGVNPLWSQILLDDKIIIPSSEDLEDSFLREYLIRQSIKTYYSIKLTDYSKSPVGFITLENYHRANPLTEEQLKEFTEIAMRISILINTK